MRNCILKIAIVNMHVNETSLIKAKLNQKQAKTKGNINYMIAFFVIKKQNQLFIKALAPFAHSQSPRREMNRVTKTRYRKVIQGLKHVFSLQF